MVRKTWPNLRFKKKVRDRCTFCRRWETSPSDMRKETENEFLDHLRSVQIARDEMKRDAEAARQDQRNFIENNVERSLSVLQFDFQANLVVPCCDQPFHRYPFKSHYLYF